jgi:hypothetical protein
MLSPMVTPARSEYVRLVIQPLIVTQKDLTHFPWVTPRVPIVFFEYLTAFFRFGSSDSKRIYSLRIASIPREMAKNG